MTATILQPGEIEPPAGEIPFLRRPERNAVFRDRAERMRALAASHSMRDFLLLMADVCDAQQASLDAFPAVPLPDEAQLRLALEHGMPPLSVASWRRHPAWQQAARQMSARLQERAPVAAQGALGRLQQMDGAGLELFADAILCGRYDTIDLAAAPFVAAALQVYWTHMVTALGARAFGRGDISNLCPACASPPVASIVRIGGSEQGLRYLTCSLCGLQWHMVRVKCSNCESTKGIAYYGIADAHSAMKAESCDECGSYLKIAYMEKDPQADPVADDLATLALDMMMDNSGKTRSGPNLLFMAPADPAA